MREAADLARIVRLELGCNLAAASCLVVGGDELAGELTRRLGEDAALCLSDPDGTGLAEEERRFDLLALLAPLPQEELERLVADGGLVVDLAPVKSGEWVIHDRRLPYRRVRVLRMTRRGQEC